MNINDYDLKHCIEYNPVFFKYEEIAQVLAYRQGEHDGDNFYWLLLLKDGHIAYLKGGCDYTGWDCRSWAEAKLVAKDITWKAGFELTPRQLIAKELELDEA